MLRTTEDMVKALDRWVLKHYPNHTTTNSHITKTQCMGVLHSFYAAGKIHYAIKCEEVVQAVDAFLEDRLWVSKDELKTLKLFPNQRPEFWLRQPNVLSCIKAAFTLWYETIRTTAALAMMAVGSVAYKFIPRKSFKLPENTQIAASFSKNS
jgi:hypothetical protein